MRQTKFRRRGNWLRPEDVNSGDVLEVISEGELVPSQFSDIDREAIDVRLPNGQQRRWSPNGTTINLMLDAWGEESASWIGKKIQIQKVQQNVRGTMRIVLFGTPVAEPQAGPRPAQTQGQPA